MELNPMDYSFRNKASAITQVLFLCLKSGGDHIGKVKCPYCGYGMPLRLSQTADCKGIFIKCKGKNCKQIFEIKVKNGRQVK